MFVENIVLKRVLKKRDGFVSYRDFLKSLSDKELHLLGKKIVWSNYDGYNYGSCNESQCYFNNLDRWQKEIYVNERRYMLCTLKKNVRGQVSRC